MKRSQFTLFATFVSTAAMLVLVLVPVPPATVPSARAQPPKQFCKPSGDQCSDCDDPVALYGCDGGPEIGDPGFCNPGGDKSCEFFSEPCGKLFYCEFPDEPPGFNPCPFISTCNEF